MVLLADIEDMIDAINAQVRRLGKEYAPKYVKESAWLKYNKGRFNIDDYIKASDTRREAIEKDVFRNYEGMDTAETLKIEKNQMIGNFNSAAKKLGVDFSVNNRNFNDFKNFVEEYEERVKDMKFKDSGAIIQMYMNYKSKRRNYTDVNDFFTQLIKNEEKEVFK